MTGPRPVAGMLDRLARLRRRVRGLSLLAGLARWVTLAAVLVTAFFLLDYLLDLPLAVRRFVRLGLLDRPTGPSTILWGSLLALSVFGLAAAARRRSGSGAFFAFAAGGLVGVLAWAAGRFVASPLSVPLPDEDLALGVEARYRSLNDRLAAALDFDRELEAPTRGESPAMMAEVVSEAEREVEGLEFGTVASARRATGRAALAAAVAAAVVLGALLAPATTSLWARRSLLLEDLRWPQATTLVAVVRDADGTEREKDPAERTVAALGQSLTVLARARGRVPADVEILDRVAADGALGKALAHRMRPVPDREGLFEFEFRDVRADFSFFLRGGDDRDEAPVYAVVVRVPPRVTDSAADLAFPDYLRLPARRVQGGSLSVPEGTRVTVSFRADTPASAATAWVGDDPVAVEGATGGPGPFSFAFVATKSTRYRLGILTPDGRTNEAGSDAYEVTVQMDTPPRSDWVWPGATIETSPEGRVPLFVRTTDDHGITSLRLEVLVGGETVPRRTDLSARTAATPDGANDLAYGADAILTYVPFEIGTLSEGEGKPVAPGTRVRLRVAATDARGQEGGGEWRAIDVSRKDEIERRLAGQRATLKGDLVGARVEQRGLREIAGQLVRGAASDADRAVLREVQFKQGKVRTDVERTCRGIAGLFHAYVHDRLGGPVPTEKILALLDRAHRRSFARDPAAPAASAGPDGEVYPWSLWREIVRARKDRLLYDSGILDKLLTVLDASAEVADGLAREAQAAAVEAASRGGAAEVEALLRAQDRLLAGLDGALSAMDEWQSLSELTLLLRRLVQDQEVLDQQIRGLKTR